MNNFINFNIENAESNNSFLLKKSDNNDKLNKKECIIDLQSFHYVTLATKPNLFLNKLKEKVYSNNEKIIIFGEDEDRFIGWQYKQNFGLKLKIIKEYLQSSEIIPNSIILFTDAYDVIYCSNSEEVIEKYLSFNMPIVFGCEKYCNPDPNRYDKYIKQDVEFPFLNSGLYIGRAWALKECLNNYNYNDEDDDQRFWTTQYFDNPNLISLDYNNELFLNTVGIDMNYFMWDKEKQIVIYKDKTPLFLHVNGPDKSLLNKLLF